MCGTKKLGVGGGVVWEGERVKGWIKGGKEGVGVANIGL